MANKIVMEGGCTVKHGMIPKWTLEAAKCKEAGVCQCQKTLPAKLLGRYDGYGKRA